MGTKEYDFNALTTALATALATAPTPGTTTGLRHEHNAVTALQPHKRHDRLCKK